MRTLRVIVALVAPACAPDLELGDPRVSAVCVDDAPLAFGGGDDRAIIDLGPFELDAPGGRRVTLAAATMTAAAGVGDLGFADHVHVALLDTDQGDVTLADSMVSGAVVELDGDPAVELGAHLRAGADHIEIAIAGDMPADRWTAALDLCFEID